MITTKKQPYELLVRWDQSGLLAGAHVGFALVAEEDGNQINWTPLNVMPVDAGQGLGFPLKDILEQLHIDAVIQMDTAQAELGVKTTECANQQATIVTLQARIDALTNDTLLHGINHAQ